MISPVAIGLIALFGSIFILAFAFSFRVYYARKKKESETAVNDGTSVSANSNLEEETGRWGMSLENDPIGYEQAKRMREMEKQKNVEAAEGIEI